MLSLLLVEGIAVEGWRTQKISHPLAPYCSEMEAWYNGRSLWASTVGAPRFRNSHTGEKVMSKGLVVLFLGVFLIIFAVASRQEVLASNVPAGYTCGLTSSILKPCQGTCP